MIAHGLARSGNRGRIGLTEPMGCPPTTGPCLHSLRVALTVGTSRSGPADAYQTRRVRPNEVCAMFVVPPGLQRGKARPAPVQAAIPLLSWHAAKDLKAHCRLLGAHSSAACTLGTSGCHRLTSAFPKFVPGGIPPNGGGGSGGSTRNRRRSSVTHQFTCAESCRYGRPS